MRALIVHEPFGSYSKGAILVNPDITADIKGGDNAHHAHWIELPDDHELVVAHLASIEPVPQGKPAKAAPSADQSA